jgi:hypothetical protein
MEVNFLFVCSKLARKVPELEKYTTQGRFKAAIRTKSKTYADDV